jgi:CHAT domain-containing protein/uncharacterized protein HemY
MNRPSHLALVFVSLFWLSPVWSQALSEEAAVRAFTEAYFRALMAKDQTTVQQLWHEQAPDRAVKLQGMSAFFKNPDVAVLQRCVVQRVTIESDKASARIELEYQVLDAQTRQEKSRPKLRRALEYARAAGQWKIWREESAESFLARALIAAQSEPERASLLATEPELLPPQLVHDLNVAGNLLSPQQSVAANELAAQIAAKIGDKFGAARSQANVGTAWQRDGKTTNAIAAYQQSLALLASLDTNASRVLLANTLLSIGRLQRLQDDYAQAITSFQQSLSHYQALQNRLGQARVLNQMGLTYLFQDDVTKATESTQQAMSLAKALPHEAEVATSLYNLGRIHLWQGELASALTHLQQSLAIRERLQLKVAVADTLLRTGNVEHRQNNYVQALNYYRKSLALGEEQKDQPTIMRALSDIGDVYLSQNNYAAALTYFQKALALSRTMRGVLLEASILNSIGTLHRLQGNYAQALEYYRQSLAIHQARDNKGGIAAMINNMSVAYHSQGDYVRALEGYTQSLKMQQTLKRTGGIAASLHNLGGIYYAQGNYEKALDHQQRALVLEETLGAKATLARVLSQLAAIQEKSGQFTQALASSQRAAALAQEVGQSDTLMIARHMAGRSHRAVNQFPQARAAFAEAIALLELQRTQVAGGEEDRQRFFARHIAPYHAMMDLYNTEGNALEALRFAERAKSRVLLDVLQHGRVNITKALTAVEQEQERKLRAEIVALNYQIHRHTEKPDAVRLNELKARHEKARLNYEALQTTLYAAHPELKTQRGEAPILNAEELAALLPDEASALLEYVVTDENTTLFVVTKAGIQAFALAIKRDDLTRQIEAFRQQLAARDLGFRAAATKLYDLLLKPARTQLKGKTNFVIVPDDKLWELPFQALRTDANRFLIEDTTIAYAPSLTVLREMTKRRRTNVPVGATLLALGNPTIGTETMERAAITLRDGKLAPLPAAEQEVKSLGQLYTRSKIYVGAEAREDRVKAEAGQMHILHFATHGILNNATPMYSHLMLAPGTTDEDGLLEAWELMQLDLQADLAVLSACETARGRFGAGEGVIGLSWALFVAGVPSTVVSQWKVESASTRDLMLQFHRSLQTGKASKAEALRQSSLSLLKQPITSHPFYWAGFVLVGDPR